jgi:hypothetical protein
MSSMDQFFKCQMFLLLQQAPVGYLSVPAGLVVLP